MIWGGRLGTQGPSLQRESADGPDSWGRGTTTMDETAAEDGL